MAIKKKIEEVIDKGGSVVENITNDDEFTYISVRLKKGMLRKLDDMLKKKVGITRNGWILQAIDKQMEYHRYER